MMNSHVASSVAFTLVLAACSLDSSPETDTTTPRSQLPETEALLVVGDWGAGTSEQEAVAAEMEDFARERPVDAIITTGDNFYSDNVGELMEPFAWATEDEIPFLVTWGNHDIESGRRIDLIDETFDDPPRWGIHEWGPVDILLLDSTQADSSEQSEFLIDTMAASDDPTILVFHHAPLSCGSHGDDRGILRDWVPAFDGDVFLVLSGHEHNYQRFESEGVTYVVSGGGGQSLTELADCSDAHPERIAGKAVHHFVALELNESLSVTVIDSDGDTVDQFSPPLP
jgi:predicted phosphodiesterase